MKRRAVLAALVSGTAGLAGCQSLGGGEGGRRTTFGVPPTESEPNDPETTTGTTTSGTTPTVRGVDPGVDPVAGATPPEGTVRALTSTQGGSEAPAGERRLVLSHLDGELPAETTLVGGFSRPPDGDAPGRVWLALRNDADRERTLGFGPTPPFSGYRGRPASPRLDRTGLELFLVPDDDRGYAPSGTVPDELGEGQGCWKATAVFASPDVRTKLALGPEETVVGEYALLLPHDLVGCLPQHGLFVFRDEVLDVVLGIAAWDPAVAAPGDSRFDRDDGPYSDRSVVSLPDFAGTAWYHTAIGASVYLEPSSERAELPSTAATFTLRNFSTEWARVDPDGWGLYKLHGGRWARVRPWGTASAFRGVPPGGEHAVRLQVDNGIDFVGEGVVVGLGGGLYAVQHGSVPLLADFDDDPLRASGAAPGDVASDPEEGPRQAQAALLRLVGDPAGVTPTVGAERTSREGSTVTVEAADGPTLGTFAVRRADPGEDTPRELIAEQINQTLVLRNAVGSFEEGVERVRVRAPPALVREPIDRFGASADGDAEDGPLLFAYRGETFLGRVETGG